MALLDEIKNRLATCGYVATDEDSAAINYAIGKATETLQNKINTVIPDGLHYVHVDMCAGMFLSDKWANGPLVINGSTLAPAPKSINIGDTSVTYGDDATNRFATMLNGMLSPSESLIVRYRKMVW